MINIFEKLLSFRRFHKETVNDYEEKLLGPNTPVRVTEAYGMVRTNLLYLGIATDKCSVVGVTSALPNEGKSLSCANLAISFVALGKRVLVVDCDMRNATQQTVFGQRATNGLSEYLSGLCEFPEVLSVRDGLRLIVAGKCPPNAAELLYNGRFATMLEKLRAEYDVIFVDLPPAGIITDAVVIADWIDGYVMVVKSGVGDRRVIKNVLEHQKQFSEKLLGFMMNGLPVESDRGSHGYSYYGYYDRHDSGEETAAEETEEKEK